MSIPTAWTQFRPSTNQLEIATSFVSLAGTPKKLEITEASAAVNIEGDQLFRLFNAPDPLVLKPYDIDDFYTMWLSFCIEEPAIGTNHWCQVEVRSGGTLIDGASQAQAVLKTVPDSQDMIFNFGLFITKDIFENGIEFFIATDIIMSMDNFILKVTRIYNR